MDCTSGSSAFDGAQWLAETMPDNSIQKRRRAPLAGGWVVGLARRDGVRPGRGSAPSPAAAGFSLVELLITVMILGLGLAMLAAAMPVGLRAYLDSSDRTAAALLANSVFSRLRASRTTQMEGESGTRARAQPFAPGLAVVECFEEGSAEVRYLFDTTGGMHTAAAGRPGEILEREGLDNDSDHSNRSSDIRTWLPTGARMSGLDPRLAAHVFYRGVPDPLAAGGVPTYQVFVVIQKTTLPADSSEPWESRFPLPSPVVETQRLAGRSDRLAWNNGWTVLPGALLVDVDSGEWARVAEVDSQTGAGGYELVLNRGLPGTRVRAINQAVDVFIGILSKELAR